MARKSAIVMAILSCTAGSAWKCCMSRIRRRYVSWRGSSPWPYCCTVPWMEMCEPEPRVALNPLSVKKLQCRRARCGQKVADVNGVVMDRDVIPGRLECPCTNATGLFVLWTDRTTDDRTCAGHDAFGERAGMRRGTRGVSLTQIERIRVL